MRKVGSYKAKAIVRGRENISCFTPWLRFFKLIMYICESVCMHTCVFLRHYYNDQ